VSVNLFGTVVNKPPYVKVDIVELDRLYQASCRLEDLTKEYEVLLNNDIVKDSIIASQFIKIKLITEEKDYHKQDKVVLEKKIKSKDKEIKGLKRGKVIRNSIIIVLVVFTLLVSAK